MTRHVFISLNNRDSGLAEALCDLVKNVFGGAFEVRFSTSKELEEGIRTGEDWFEWIVKQVTECDVALVLITPNSIQAPWLMWESGAVFGAATASGDGGYGKVWPVVFQLKSDEIPSPIQDSKAQRRYGDRVGDIRQLILEMFERYKGELPPGASSKIADLNDALNEYISAVQGELLNAPAIPTNNVLEEWRQRIRTLGAESRASEVKQLQHWMEVAFGHERTCDKYGTLLPQPVDLSIHVQLGELYAKNNKYREAIEQFELARRLGSRDIFVLRRLGRFYLEDKRPDQANEVIGRIRELDPRAFEANAECAALLGRFHRESGNLREAADAFKAALPTNPESYYLANVAAETYLELGDQPNAAGCFRQALRIIDEQVSDNNIWTAATRTNALLALGDFEEVRRTIDGLLDMKPARDELQTIKRGLKGIARQLEPKPSEADLKELFGKLS